MSDENSTTIEKETKNLNATVHTIETDVKEHVSERSLTRNTDQICERRYATNSIKENEDEDPERELQIPGNTVNKIKIECVRLFGQRNDHPIVAKFAFFKDKNNG